MVEFSGRPGVDEAVPAEIRVANPVGPHSIATVSRSGSRAKYPKQCLYREIPPL
jgi:hypothetical protein